MIEIINIILTIMAFLPPDDFSFDAFSRLRVSETTNILDFKQVGAASNYLLDTQVSGSGAIAYSVATSSSTLTVLGSAGTSLAQTKTIGSYQAGKSLVILTTATVFTFPVGITKNIGYFDNNNGLMFRFKDNVVSVVIRNNGVETIIPRSNWNGYKLDGVNDFTGITLDFTKSLIFGIDFQWLGVGTVRFFVVINEKIYYLHLAHHSNIKAGVYLANPNLPVSWSIANSGSGGVSQLEFICASIFREGGFKDNYITRVITKATATTTNAVANRAVFSFRATNDYAMVLIERITLAAFTNSSFGWGLVLNPTIVNADTAVWTQFTNGSEIEYDNSRTNTITYTDNQLICGGHQVTTLNFMSQELQLFLSLRTSLLGIKDQYVLFVRPVGGGGEDFYGAINLREFN